MDTLAKALDAGHHGPAVIGTEHGVEMDYHTLAQQVKSFEQTLTAYGLGPGDAVSMSLPNGIEFVVAFLATTCARLVAAPLNPAYIKDEVEFYLADAKSKMLIVPKGWVEQKKPAVEALGKFKDVILAEISWNGKEVLLEVKNKPKKGGRTETRQPKPEDVALLLHTSGTTGRPKGVPLTHKNLTTTMRNIIDTYKLSKNDRTYLVMPLFHVHGLLCGLLAVIASGGSIVVPPKFSAQVFWTEFVNYQCNWYTAVPTIHQILLRTKLPDKLPQLRFIRSCSSSLSPSTFHDLEKTFKAPVLEAYAMTEASHQMTSNPLPPMEHRPGSVGIGQGVEVVILDDAGNKLDHGKIGEVSIKGANVTKGYLNNEKANQESFTNGFFRTGDQGKLDEKGYLTLTGRIKELIKRGGEQISPIEVDGVLLGISFVSEAVCFAVDDEMYGQEVHAVVVLADKAKGAPEKKEQTEKEIKELAGQKLSKFKIPKKILFVDEITKTGRCVRIFKSIRTDYWCRQWQGSETQDCRNLWTQVARKSQIMIITSDRLPPVYLNYHCPVLDYRPPI